VKAASLIDKLFSQPYISINLAAELINATYPTASTLVQNFEKDGILTSVRDVQRNKIYAFRPYLDILHEATDELSGVIDGDDYLGTQPELRRSP